MDPVIISPRIADKVYSFMSDCFGSVADIVDPGSVVYRDSAQAHLTEAMPYHGHGHFDGKGDYIPLGYGSVPDDEPTNHCHVRKNASSFDFRARKKLVVASVLCLVFMMGEAVGGALAHSLAVVTDAAHLLTDFASFMISLMAIYLASRPPTKSMTFGWLRAEVMGAMISILMIWLVTGILVYLAVLRVIDQDYEIHAEIMVVTAAVGVVFNLVMGLTLHQHSHGHLGGGHSHDVEALEQLEYETDLDEERDENSHQILLNDGNHSGNRQQHSHSHSHGHSHGHNINVKAAFIHVLGDFCQSLGVLIAALVVYLKPEYKIADPICTFVFSIMVLLTTINILKDTMNVLMEGSPVNLDFLKVKEAFFEIAGVKHVHNLRLWSLTSNKVVLSVHLALNEVADHNYVLKQATRLARRRYHVHDVTVQLETFAEDMLTCRDCKDPE